VGRYQRAFFVCLLLFGKGIVQHSVEFFFFFKDFIYLFGRQRHSEKGNISRGSGRGRSRLPAEQGAPQIPGPWDHHLS